MATKTTNYDLTKPIIDEAYDIEVQNGNMDKIDTALTGQRDKIANLEANGSATDNRIGDRTISDASAPTGNAGKLTTLLGWLAHMIKAITGKTSWRDAPATNLEAAKTHMDDKTVHITSTERTTWNAKESTTGAQAKADAAKSAAITAAAADATSKADAALGAAKDYSVNAVYNSATNTDPNTTETPFIVTNHANAPDSTSYWYIYTYFLGNKTGNKAQIAIMYYSANPRMYMRTNGGGTWYGWRELASTGYVDTAVSNASTAANNAFVNAISNGSSADPNVTEIPYIITNHANSPNSVFYWHIQTLYYQSKTGNRAQIAVQYNGGDSKLYTRSYFSTSWTDWKEFASLISPNFIGTPTTPSPGIHTKNNQVAPTAFVHDVADSRTRFGTTTGTSTVYVLTLTPAPTAMYVGMDVKIKLHTASGANPTLNVNGHGPKALYAGDGVSRFVGVTGRVYTWSCQEKCSLKTHSCRNSHCLCCF